MSYIRSSSNVEGLYIYGGANGISVNPGRSWKATNIGMDAIVVPYGDFARAADMFKNGPRQPIYWSGNFYIREGEFDKNTGEDMECPIDIEDPVFDRLMGGIRIGLVRRDGDDEIIEDKFVVMYQVTWEYVCRAILNDLETVKETQ